MDYIGRIIRPPSEARSLLLQVTLGCSHNACTFCPTYREKPFRMKSLEVIEEDLNEASELYPGVKRLFLCDGDALIIKHTRLISIFNMIHRYLPELTRITTYANAKGVLLKTQEELEEYKNNKLSMIYLGIETGWDTLLEEVNKGVRRSQIMKACEKIKQAGIKLSVTVLLGLAGNQKERSEKHISETADLLNCIQADYIAALTVMPVPGTEFYSDVKSGKIVMQDSMGILKEQYQLISLLNLDNSMFLSNHASNYLPLKISRSSEKSMVLQEIEDILKLGDNSRLRSEYLRGL